MGKMLGIKGVNMSAYAPTLKDLALETGLTRQSVSFILNKRSRYAYSEETRQRVFAAAKKMGYRPNAMARAARSGRFGQIGFIYCSSHGRSYVPDLLMRGIQDEVNSRGLNLIVNGVSEESLLKEASVPKMLSELMLDGLLINYLYSPSKELVNLINGNNIPALILNEDLKFDCVRPDDYQAGFDATRHLISLGHKRIAFVQLNRNEDLWKNKIYIHYSEIHRYAGYCDAMSESGLEPRLILGNEKLWKMSEACTGEPEELNPWLFEKKRPTAIVVYSGTCGFPTIYKSIYKRDMRIPDDISILMFETLQYEFEGFPVTTMAEPNYELGKTAVAALMEKVEGRTKIQEVIKIPFELVPGASTAPVKNLI